MKVRLKTLSEAQLPGYTPKQSEVLISITDFGTSCLEPPAGFVDFLALQYSLSGREAGISIIEAFDIRWFVQKNLPKLKSIVVQCPTGKNRSAGVVVALAEIFRHEILYKDRYPDYHRQSYQRTIKELRCLPDRVLERYSG